MPSELEDNVKVNSLLQAPVTFTAAQVKGVGNRYFDGIYGINDL
jgi:hypothetical protein